MLGSFSDSHSDKNKINREDNGEQGISLLEDSLKQLEDRVIVANKVKKDLEDINEKNDIIHDDMSYYRKFLRRMSKW